MGWGERCVFGVGWRVGRAWRCIYHGFPGVEGGQRRFRERIESGRGRAHCICGMTFVVLSLTTCDAVRWSLLPPPPPPSSLFVVITRHCSIAVVAAVARAWILVCRLEDAHHYTSPVSRRSRAAGKLALSLVGPPTVIQRVHVRVCV